MLEVLIVIFEKVGTLLLYIIAVVFCKDLLVQVCELHQYIWHIYLTILLVVPTSLLYFHYKEKKSRLVHSSTDYRVRTDTNMNYGVKSPSGEWSEEDKKLWEKLPNATVLSTTKRPQAEWGEIIKYKVE